MNKQYRPRVSKNNYDEVMGMALIGDNFDVALRRYRKRAHGLELCWRNSLLKNDEISILISKNKDLQRELKELKDEHKENRVNASKVLVQKNHALQCIIDRLTKEKIHSLRLRNALIVVSAIALSLAFM
jgi:hypothetical protein